MKIYMQQQDGIYIYIASQICVEPTNFSCGE